MLSTTPYLQTALQATAAAHVFETHAATLPKPRSVALTAMTEGPLQRNLAVEFWSPHIAHLSGSANVMPDTYKSLSVFYRLPETYVCHTCAETHLIMRMRVSYLEGKNYISATKTIPAGLYIKYAEKKDKRRKVTK